MITLSYKETGHRESLLRKKKESGKACIILTPEQKSQSKTRDSFPQGSTFWAENREKAQEPRGWQLYSKFEKQGGSLCFHITRTKIRMRGGSLCFHTVRTKIRWGGESVFPLHKDQGQTSERKEGRARHFLVSQVEFRFYSQSVGEY